MIRVNLLPEEYRKVESTSLSLFLLFLIGVVLVALAFVAWLTLSLQGGSIASDLEERRAHLKNVSAAAKRVDELKEDLAQYSKRRTTVMSIRAGRIYWSKKLDLLVKDTPSNIWFTSIRMVQNEPIKAVINAPLPANADGGFLELQCFQCTDDYKILAAYRDTLMKDRILYADVDRIKEPNFTKTKWNPPVVEEDQWTLSFKVVLYLKPQVIPIEH